MPWPIIGAIAGPVLGGLLGGSASQSAADTQSQAALQAAQVQNQAGQQAVQLQKDIYGQTTQNLQPYLQAGTVPLSALQELTGVPGSGNLGVLPEGQYNNYYGYGSFAQPFDMSKFQASPAYNFNLEQGQQAIDKAAAARGNYYAPKTLQDISKFSQGLASNEFQNAYSNYNQNINNLWNRLYSLTGTGQQAATQQGAFGAGMANQAGSNIVGGANALAGGITGAGAAQAAGTVGQANALGGGLSGAYNNYLMQQILSGNQAPSVGGVITDPYSQNVAANTNLYGG